MIALVFSISWFPRAGRRAKRWGQQQEQGRAAAATQTDSIIFGYIESALFACRSSTYSSTT